MTDRPLRRLPIEDDMRFQKATWMLERAGWGGLALVIIAALAGVFSNGYLSRTALRQDGFAVEYERFQRASVMTPITVTLPESREVEAPLRFGRALQEHYKIETIEPRPARGTAGEAGLDLYFEPPEHGPLTIVLWVRPRAVGFVALRAASRGTELNLPAFIYP